MACAENELAAYTDYFEEIRIIVVNFIHTYRVFRNLGTHLFEMSAGYCNLD